MSKYHKIIYFLGAVSSLMLADIISSITSELHRVGLRLVGNQRTDFQTQL